MCWNAEVSLNTFIFSSFVLVLIIYNNQFTKYKIHELNKWMYLFFASFIFMQLIEFFIWKNINNPYYNQVFSTIAVILLLMQPIASMMLLPNGNLRNLLLISYLLIATPYSIYNFMHKRMHSIVSPNGHLNWMFFHVNAIVWFVWLFFFLFSFIYQRKLLGFIFACVTLFITYLNYKNENTVGSMWCWVVNSLMIYYAAYLLMYLPFLERGSIC
jgi:4-amino-4-deoxy-L-arabinose transferase-like glycosyltransferase